MADLNTKQRAALPKTDFAIPEKAPGSGSYPIPDLAHARDALSRSSGKPEEARVRAAVYRKFPQLKNGSGDKESPSEDKGENEKGETYDSVISKFAARLK